MSTTAVIARLDALLKPLGFMRKELIWNRKSNAFVDVIDVQTSKTGDAVTVNVGVLLPEVHVTCWGTEPLSFIEEPSCTVRTRVGQLIDGRDLWWRLTESGIVNDITEKLTVYVLPFLERMHSHKAVEEFLTSAQVAKQRYPPLIIYLAILKSNRGDTAGACVLLAELHKRTVRAWQARVREVAKRLGCS